MRLKLRSDMGLAALLILIVSLLSAFALGIAGYVTNIVWLMAGHPPGTEWVVAVIGIFVPFVGALHGFLLW